MRSAKHDDLDSALYHWFVQARESAKLHTTLAGTEEVLGLVTKIEKTCQEKRRNSLKQSTLPAFIKFN